MSVGLMPDIPDQPVARRVEDMVESDRQFDDAEPGAELRLVDADGATTATGTTDDAGSFVFRTVPAATGYTVVDAASDAASAHSVGIDRGRGGWPAWGDDGD